MVGHLPYASCSAGGYSHVTWWKRRPPSQVGMATPQAAGTEAEAQRSNMRGIQSSAEAELGLELKPDGCQAQVLAVQKEEMDSEPGI